MQVFEFDDYRAFILAKIDGYPNGGWGIRSEIAEALSCQTAYLSRILGGTAQMSLEQAEELTRYFALSEDESEFLILLVSAQRAGTKTLRARFERKIKAYRAERLNLAKRFKLKAKLSAEDQAVYYSAWYYSAIHVSLSLPNCESTAAIAKRLSLKPELVKSVITFLASVGLAKKTVVGFRIGETRIHAGATSPFIRQHLTNWRLQAIQSLDQYRDEDLHYSGIISLSKLDQTRIREILVAAIEQSNSIVANSPEEAVCGFSIDLFEIGAP